QPPLFAALPTPLPHPQPHLPYLCASGAQRRSATCATSGRACLPPRPSGWTPPPAAAPMLPHSSTPTSPAVTCQGWIWGCSRTCPGSATGRAPNWPTRRCNAARCFYQPTRRWVCAMSDLVKASLAMRCFSKVSSGSPLVRFTDRQDDLNDLGDGGGAPVHRWVSMLEFENLAKELVEMFVSELQLKSIGLGSGDSFPLPENWKADVLQARRPGHTPSHEVLQVYLTSWLANVNIKTNRIDEIFELVGEEMQIKLR
uniref:Uncharacterized protein n=2 Tax=Aegilops tauschii subsp. strangulata TaxID=200361 RepID=A0A453IN12_AEGTS